MLAACLAVAIGLGSASAGELVISEVFFDPPGVNTGRQTIELRNASNRTLDLASEDLWLRVAPGAYRLPAGVVLAPGDHLLVHVNRAGTASARELFTGLSVRELRSSDSIALFRSSLFQDPTRLEQFVQWGAASLGGEAVAVAAGLWPEGGFVDTSGLRSGSSLSLRGTSFDSPASWCIDGTPTPNAPNDTCSPSRAIVGSRIEEVGLRAGNAFVEIRNRRQWLEDLGSLVLGLGEVGSYRFPAGTLLGPDEAIVVRVGQDGESGPVELFTGSEGYEPTLPRVGGVVTLHAGVAVDLDPSRLVDYVAWGAPGSPFDALASANGLWSGPPLALTGLHASGALARTASGTGPTAWRADNTPTPGLPNDAPPSAPELVINELLVAPLEPEASAIELLHRGPQTFDLAGVTVVWSLGGGLVAQATLPSGRSLAPGELFVIWLGASGNSDESNLYLPLAPPLPREGECALLLGDDISDAESLIDFVRWGREAAGPLQSPAVARFLWPEDATIETITRPEGASLAYLGEGDSPAAFRFDRSPSPGEPNDEAPANLPFRRGDCNDDGSADISDAVTSFGFLFLGSAPPFCRKACDANDDESVDVSDPVYLLNFLFRGGVAPRAPHPDCGSDPDERLRCDAYVSC